MMAIVAATLLALLPTESRSGALLQYGNLAGLEASPLALEEMPGGVDFRDSAQPVQGSTPIMGAVSRGAWGAACSMAADSLARQQPDIEALGVFTICAAIRNDRSVAIRSLEVLRGAESPPYQFAHVAQAILDLRDSAPWKALERLSPLRSADVGSPLASYFAGEALHTLDRDAEAVRAFNDTLARWPEHAPALAAVARLMAEADDTPATLKTAIAMTERATQVNPENLGYWRQLADLCERDGQSGRASAIRLQWLTRRIP
jgi:hypothetical protein